MKRQNPLAGIMVLVVLVIIGSRSVLAQTGEQPAPAATVEAQPAAAGKPPVQSEQPARPGEPLTTANKLRLQVNVFEGFGLDSSTVGVTSTGDSVRISGGGGWGFGATAGYGLSKRYDIEGTLGVQASGLRQAMNYADAIFGRSFLLATAKYKVPIRENLWWKFGLGAGYYMAGKLNVDVNAVHTKVDYKNAAGAHATGELEILLQERLSLSMGLKYYNVTYKADKATVNGITVPVSSLPGELREFTGDGVDVTAGIAVLF